MTKYFYTSRHYITLTNQKRCKCTVGRHVTIYIFTQYCKHNLENLFFTYKYVTLTGAGYFVFDFLETCHKCDVSFASILKRRVSTVN